MGCFIDSITVSYDGDGVPAFFRGDNRPVIVDLTIKFRERAVLTASDYGDEGDAVGKETINNILNNQKRTLQENGGGGSFGGGGASGGW